MAKASKTFWYKVLDLMHYSHVNLTGPHRGYMMFTKKDWARAFYKDAPTEASDRSWERFKRTGRGEELFVSLPGDEVEKRLRAQSSRETPINDRVAVMVEPAQDAVYVALGPPHPAGLKAQIRCEREARGSLLQLVVLGVAAAARVEQRRRMVG